MTEISSPYWMKNLQTGIHGPGRPLTKEQTASRSNHLWPEIWKNMSDAAQRREKQKWAIEKRKFDNARKLRGIHFIDPTDAEFQETVKNARKKLEVPMPASMPCEIRRSKVRGDL